MLTLERIEVASEYLTSEAGFVDLVLKCGGVFVMRQFCDFVGASSGAKSDSFIRKARAQEKLSSFRTRNATVVHVLDGFGKPSRQDAMKRLMVLDFALAHRDREYLWTSEEQVEYVQSLGAGLDEIPSKLIRGKSRYFTERHPFYKTSNGAGLVYVDTGTTSGLDTFLGRYLPLAVALPYCEVVLFTQRPEPAGEIARGLFVKRLAMARGGDNACASERMLELLEREQLEAMDVNSLNFEQLRRLGDLRASIAPALYRKYLAGGLECVTAAQPGSVVFHVERCKPYDFL